VIFKQFTLAGHNRESPITHHPSPIAHRLGQVVLQAGFQRPYVLVAEEITIDNVTLPNAMG
jgi:hypothetical protein